MTERLYEKPPITESVVELRFSQAISMERLERLQQDFAKHYPDVTPRRNIGVEVRVDEDRTRKPVAEVNEEDTGFRCATADQTEILILAPSAIAVSQLAPYNGWASFFGRFKRDWDLYKKQIGHKRIDRIGVRYINRIDIPFDGSAIDHENFVDIFVSYPDQLGPQQAYAVQLALFSQDIGCGIKINSSSVESPVIGHISFVLDIDVAKNEDVPQNDREIFELMERIRLEKNRVFEACITDKTRETFSV